MLLVLSVGLAQYACPIELRIPTYFFPTSLLGATDRGFQGASSESPVMLCSFLVLLSTFIFFPSFAGFGGSGSQVDTARMTLASSFVNGFVNAAFGQDKLLTDDGNKWLYKNKDHGIILFLFCVILFSLFVLLGACVIRDSRGSSL